MHGLVVPIIANLLRLVQSFFQTNKVKLLSVKSNGEKLKNPAMLDSSVLIRTLK